MGRCIYTLSVTQRAFRLSLTTYYPRTSAGAKRSEPCSVAAPFHPFRRFRGFGHSKKRLRGID